MAENTYTAAVITVSDKGFRGEREDTSGPALCEMLSKEGWQVVYTALVPDERDMIVRELLSCADEKGVALVLTTGGTGFSPRDITPEATLEVVERLSDEDRVDLLEINVSCPNVKEGAIAFGQNPDSLFHITQEIKKKAKQPVIMKLTPNVTSIAQTARAAEAGGADAISLINTITGMKIDVERQRFVLANRTGGLSGPAIRPVAVRMVYEAAQAVSIPIIGMGGIGSAEDALEFILAGASAVAVGAMNFHDPLTMLHVIDGLEDYCRRHGIERISELTGAVHA